MICINYKWKKCDGQRETRFLAIYPKERKGGVSFAKRAKAWRLCSPDGLVHLSAVYIHWPELSRPRDAGA